MNEVCCNHAHCCDYMHYQLDIEEDIHYEPVTRHYAIHTPNNHSGNIKSIWYCPWCGKKLPKDLGDEYDEEIFRMFGKYDYDSPNLPEEFKTDEWWKKRGL